MPTSKKLSASKTSVRHKTHKTSQKVNSQLPKQMIFVFLSSATVLLFAVLGINLFQQQQSFCANSISCIKDLSGAFDPKGKSGTFKGKQIVVPAQTAIAYTNPTKSVLGETTGNKRIEVNLSNQHLYAYEGDTVVMDFPVSTGKWHYTPTGEFSIWVKLRYTKMEGGSGSGYYYLPNVPYTMFYSSKEVPKGAGYSIHGAYWHNNFGHPMSHGCVNMAIEDAGKIFAWADPTSTGWANPATPEDPGTKIIVYGETPRE